MQYRIFHQGDEMAATKFAEDAARLVAGCPGWIVKVGRKIVWREGCESQSASESFDYAAAVMIDRAAGVQFPPVKS